jgi:hypothetical protein
MKKQRDLLPWILGALSLATVAAAMTVVVAGKPLTPKGTSLSGDAAQVSAGPASLPVSPASVSLPLKTATELTAAAGSAPSADIPASPPPDRTQAATEPPVESGQIWECTTNGVKTFSNNPCGEKSTLLEVRAINTMNPVPPVRYARTSAPEPRYAPQYADPNTYGDPNAYGQDSYADQGNGDYAGNSYSVVQGYAFLPRRRSEHPHRPESHHNSGPTRKN